jgi:DNA-binding response OmpR family regulator
MKTRQHHVLYIEDHVDTCDLVALVLAKHNYRVTTGSTIADALKLAREDCFDLYMLDSWLPDGSGIDLCKKLRELHPGIPIVFLSGAAYQADKQNAINSGAQGYFTKPADLDTLCSEVRKLIDVFPRKEEFEVSRLVPRGFPEDNPGFELASTVPNATFKW